MASSKTLEDVLDNYDEALKNRVVRDGERRNQTEQFAADVEHAIEDIIRPTMEAIRKTLQERGHRCEIEDAPVGATTSTSQERTRQIVMTVEARREPTETGSVVTHSHRFGFLVMPHERHLHAISATMGQREPQHRAVFEISEVTPDAVRDQVVSFLAEVLRG